MKKVKFLIVFVIVMVLVTGCGKMSKKEIEAAKVEMTNYIKSNMNASWNYADEKLAIDDELNTKVKMYNVLDLTDCVIEAKEAYVSLKRNLDDKSYLKKVDVVCEYKSENVGMVSVDDIKKLNTDKYETEANLYDSNGTKVEVNEDFYKTQKDEFISKCQKYSYKEIFRNSENYVGKYAVFTGEVVQVIDNKEFYDIRINVTKDEYGYYDDTMYASIPKSYFQGRILEDDIITIYGRLSELNTYKSIFGADVTIPAMYVRYAELNN